MLLDILDEALTVVFGRPGRALLASLGTILGVSALVCVSTLNESSQAEVNKTFDSVSATYVTVIDPHPEVQLNIFDSAALARLGTLGPSYRGVETLSLKEPLDVCASKVARASCSKSTVVGSNFDALLGPLQIPDMGLRGSAHLAERSRARVAIVGAGLLNQLGMTGEVAHASLMIDGLPFNIVGVISLSPVRPDLKNGVVIPRSTLLELAPAHGGLENLTHELLVRTPPGAGEGVINSVITAVAPQAEQAVQAEVPPSIKEIRAAVNQDMADASRIVALICVSVGALMIATFGLMGVLQRRREFGVRRAMGAQSSHLLLQVLAETLAIGLWGSILGLLLGLGVAFLWSYNLGWQLVASPVVLLAAPAIGLATGMLAGLLPSWKASRVKPMEALRAL